MTEEDEMTDNVNKRWAKLYTTDQWWQNGIRDAQNSIETINLSWNEVMFDTKKSITIK